MRIFTVVRIPEKITVRLDFTSREMLAHYLHRKSSCTASIVLRRALRAYLAAEQAEYALSDPVKKTVAAANEVEMAERSRKAVKP
jgi:hypothetical protein